MAKRRQIVPECANALNQMKFEIASELGVPFGHSATGDFDSEFAGELGSISGASMGKQYYGDLSSRQAGSVGGEITKRLVRQAQQTIV
ncbi:MAG: alpha/beta-type small acid-soluble spore protein [Candidatus Cohnella colombiensis]|uniref:Alpha/beta-type small acid-soluble spore protein n=1 Tax=Candidatus Cohnella colombiensis TaxID=3121368 RepID=A0AA95JCH5_9BACL|nr:MAG: alpha/beta-type small acid-soluble spore protein [Cohnella sp.]